MSFVLKFFDVRFVMVVSGVICFCYVVLIVVVLFNWFVMLLLGVIWYLKIEIEDEYGV